MEWGSVALKLLFLDFAQHKKSVCRQGSLIIRQGERTTDKADTEARSKYQ